MLKVSGLVGCLFLAVSCGGSISFDSGSQPEKSKSNFEDSRIAGKANTGKLKLSPNDIASSMKSLGGTRVTIEIKNLETDEVFNHVFTEEQDIQSLFDLPAGKTEVTATFYDENDEVIYTGKSTVVIQSGTQADAVFKITPDASKSTGKLKISFETAENKAQANQEIAEKVSEKIAQLDGKDSCVKPLSTDWKNNQKSLIEEANDKVYANFNPHLKTAKCILWKSSFEYMQVKACANSGSWLNHADRPITSAEECVALCNNRDGGNLYNPRGNNPLLGFTTEFSVCTWKSEIIHPIHFFDKN